MLKIWKNLTLMIVLMLGWNLEAYSLFPFKAEMVAAVYWFSLVFLRSSPDFLFVLNGQNPIALAQWEPGRRDDFFPYVFKFISITKAYFPLTFYHCHLKSVFWLPQCDPPCLFSGFLPLFLGTWKHICAAVPMSISARPNLMDGRQ